VRHRDTRPLVLRRDTDALHVRREVVSIVKPSDVQALAGYRWGMGTFEQRLHFLLGHWRRDVAQDEGWQVGIRLGRSSTKRGSTTGLGLDGLEREAQRGIRGALRRAMRVLVCLLWRDRACDAATAVGMIECRRRRAAMHSDRGRRAALRYERRGAARCRDRVAR